MLANECTPVLRLLKYREQHKNIHYKNECPVSALLSALFEYKETTVGT
jgi:hypothetical protein